MSYTVFVRKWAHPAEWLDHHLDAFDQPHELRAIALTLASALDGDQIQDLFQAEMDADGYFTPLRKRSKGGDR